MRFAQKRKLRNNSAELIATKKIKFSTEFWLKEQKFKRKCSQSCELEQVAKCQRLESSHQNNILSPQTSSTSNTAFDLKFFSNFCIVLTQNPEGDKFMKDFPTDAIEHCAVSQSDDQWHDNNFWRKDIFDLPIFMEESIEQIEVDEY